MVVHAFYKDISLKMNIIAQLEFELACFKVAVRHFNYYTMGSPQKRNYKTKKVKLKKKK